MSRNLILIAIVLIAGATAYSFISLERTVKGNSPTPYGSSQAQAPPAALPAPGTEDDEARSRRAAMRAEYDRLEQARAAVRKQLGRLNSRLWKLRVEAEQSRAIQEQMQQGHALLKNPPLLGAFSSPGEITREIEKVREVNERLKSLETEVEEYLASQQSP